MVELYRELTNEEELQGAQKRIASNLAQQLTAVQIAQQLQSSSKAS